MQFENEFARSWHIRREKAVARFNAGEMDVGGYAFSKHPRCTGILQKNARAKIFGPLRVGIKTPRENCRTVGEIPEELAARNSTDQKEMRRKERQIKALAAQILGLRTTRAKPTRFVSLERRVYCCGLLRCVKSSRLRHIDATNEDDLSRGIIN